MTVAGVFLLAFAWGEDQRFRETILFPFAIGAACVTAGVLFSRYH